MKHSALKTLLLTLLFFGFAATLSAQDDNTDNHDVTVTVPEVARLDIETAGNSSLALGPVDSGEAGAPLDFSSATDNTLWINYSSTVGSTTEATRKVTVAITDGTVPGGMDLKVVSAVDAGNGEGTVGTPTAEVNLDATAQDVITGIGSCYTADGVNNGHQLTYSLVRGGDYSDIDFDESGTVLTITYTLTDN